MTGMLETEIEFEMKDEILYCVNYPTIKSKGRFEIEDEVNDLGQAILQAAHEFIAPELQISEFEYNWEGKVRQDFPFVINTY